MFSLKKIVFTRRPKWIRGRVGSRIRNSVDIEAAPSRSTGSSVATVASTERTKLPSPKQFAKKEITSHFGSGYGVFIGKRGSNSEPTLGPLSNPNEFRLDGESGWVIPKSSSTLSVATGGTRFRPVKNGESHHVSNLRQRVTTQGNNSDRAGPSGPVASERSRKVIYGNAPENIPNENLEMVAVAGSAAEETQLPPRPQYLQGYLDLMCITGTSRRIPVDWRDKSDAWTWLKKCFTLVLFCFVTIFSCWDSSNEGKLRFLYFMDGQGLSFFVDFSFNMSCLLMHTYSAFKFTLRINEIDTMLSSIDEYEQEYDSQADCHCNHWKLIIKVVCIATLLISVAETVFENGFEEWSLEMLGRIRSFEFSAQLYLWSHKYVSNHSYDLEWAYGRPENYNVGYAFMSALGCMSTNFKMGALRDLVLIGVFVIFLIVFGLQQGISGTTGNAPKENIAALRTLQAKREKLFKQYRKVRLVIDSFNLVMDKILLLLHINNLLLYGYFACMWIAEEEISLMLYIEYVFNIFKAELTYFLGKRIFAANFVIDKWLQNWSCHTGKIVVDGEEYDVHVLLHELDKMPIGIGTGIFQISQQFHLTFLTMVLSLILFMADQRAEKK